MIYSSGKTGLGYMVEPTSSILATVLQLVNEYIYLFIFIILFAYKYMTSFYSQNNIKIIKYLVAKNNY